MHDIRALLLTDVVDSTQLSQRLGDRAMADVWAAHDRVARDLLPRWRGREIDKTDGMLLLFEQPADAVHYALAYHRALAALPVPLKARAGLHVGPVILRENLADDVARGAKPLEVDGLAKPTAARVMSLARGGQTLLTAEAHEALDDGLTRSAWQACSHGHWVLKGVAEPVELFEVGDDPQAFAAPPDGDKVYRVVRLGERWLPVRQIANNLPEQLTSFIGRERELSELKALLNKTRLLTLLGMGGLGKTRLSLQVAAELMAEYPDGVWFLDLAPLRDGTLVVSEAAQTLGVREEPGRPLLQTLCACLKPRRVLIILDNCEHLLKATALLAHAVLKAAPQVAIMASSREALRVPGERSYPIVPLPVPGRADSFETLSRSTAVLLFVERAQEHRIDFTLTEAEAPAVGELVARLEGIPLALELAAARVRSMTVADINRRLKDRYQVLTDGSIVLEERQQTLRALVDWSYDLLDPVEQRVLQRVAVFAGGFDLAAAEPVCGADGVANGVANGVDNTEVLDRLASLVEKSLLQMDHREGRARYRMLETLRDYAREKLDAAGDALAVAERHCLHYFALAKEANSVGLKGPQQAWWVDRLENELDNLRVATALALAGGVDPFIAVKLPVALLGFWLLRGYATEGRQTIRAALALPAIQASDLAQSHALYVGAALADNQSDHAEARALLEQCLALRRRLGNPADIAATLSTLALAQLGVGDAEGARRSEGEALQGFRDCGHRFGEAVGLVHLGHFGLFLGDDVAARDTVLQGLALAREIRNPEIEAECEWVLGRLDVEADDRAGARRRFEASLALCEATGDKRGAANARWWLGKLALLESRPEAAQAHIDDALLVFRGFEMREQMLGCLDDHAALAEARGALHQAVALRGHTERAREQLHGVLAPRDRRRLEQQLSRLRQALPGDEFEAGWSQGRGWSLDEAVAQALAPQG